MNTPTPITGPPSDKDSGRLGFIADLAFVLCVPWLILWRVELPAVPAASIWGSAWPALFTVGLCGVAVTVGVLHRRPRGFLPYGVRWGLLAAVLVLPASIAFSMADARGQGSTLATAAVDLRTAVESPADSGSGLNEQQREKVLATADAADKLAEVVDQAQERGIQVPRADLATLAEAAGMDLTQLPPATRDSLEQAMGIAQTMENGGDGTDEFSQFMRDSGLDNPVVQRALIGLAAAALAPLIGLSPALLAALLEALVMEGKITLGGVFRVVAALATSTRPGGGFDPNKLGKNLERYRAIADDVAMLAEAAQKFGGPNARGSDTLSFLKKTALEAAQKSPPRECPPDQIEKARKGPPEGLRNRLETKFCKDLRPNEIDQIMGVR